MKIATWFKNLVAPKKKSIITSPITTAVLLGMNNYQAWAIDDYPKYASEGYIGNHVVFSCIDKITKCAADVELLTYNVAGKDKVEVINEVTALFKKPNPNKTWSSFLIDVLSYLLIGGNCYIYVLKIGSSPKPRELWCLRPDCVTRNDDGSITYQSEKGDIRYEAEQIVHIQTFNPTSDKFGVSRVQISGLSIDQNTGGKKWNANLVLQGGRPPGALYTETEADIPTQERIIERYTERTAGPSNAGKPLFLEGGLKWQQLGLSPADMEWITGLKMSTVDITAIYGVPPELIGYPEFRTYNNVSEAKSQFYEDTVLPWLKFILGYLNEFVSKQFGEYEVMYNPDNIKALKENIDAVWTRVGMAKADGRLSLNEAREAMGYDPIPKGGDFIYGNMGQYPIATTTGEEVPEFEMPSTEVPSEEELAEENQEENEPE